jgi:hypothetical protein
MRIRTTAAAVLVAAAGTLALTGVAHAQTDERDCEDFTSQRQAQAVLDSPAGDPERLDADRDGRACEIWFANQAQAGTDSATGSDPKEAAADEDAADGSATRGNTAGGSTGDGSSAGPARQVSPVPRGGVDTGRDIAGPLRPNPPSPILWAAAFAVAGTAAAGAAAAARPAPVRSRGSAPVPGGPVPVSAIPRPGHAAPRRAAAVPVEAHRSARVAA